MALITFLKSYNSEHICECAYLKLEYAFLLLVECCDRKFQIYIWGWVKWKHYNITYFLSHNLL